MEQGSYEWHELRLGKFTASTIYKLMGERALKKGCDGHLLEHWSDGAQTFILEKVAELCGVPGEETYSRAMEWGKALEPYAKRHYEGAFSETLEDRAFIVSDFSDQAGCSPDSFIVGKHKGVEFKCPYTSTNHIKYSLINSNKDLITASSTKYQYYDQVQMCMLVTGFPVWDFVTYDPRFDPKLRMYAFEIKIDDERCKVMKDRILAAVEARDNILKILNY